MKNCIEHPDLLSPDFSPFSSDSRSKLAHHLQGAKTDPFSLTDEDVQLFSIAARRWNISSLHDICEKARQRKEKSRAKPDETNRRRTRSESVIESKGHEPLQRGLSAQSFDLPGAVRSHDDNSYLLLFGEAKGKTGVVVYGIRNRRIHQKAVDISKKPEHLKDVCCGYIEDAPFLFFLHVCPKNHVDLTAYDVLEDTMKSRAKLKERCELSSMVNIGSYLACFRRNSDTVELFNIAKNKWMRPFKLFNPVNLPVLVAHEERVYIFSEKIVQCYDVISGRVTSSQISEFVSTGHGFMFEGRMNILSDSSRIEYDALTGHCRRYEFPHLGYRPIHKAFSRRGRVFVLITSSAGKFELLSSNNLVEWIKVLSFPKTLQLVCTEVLDFFSPCPFAPFETFDESLRQPKFTLS